MSDAQHILSYLYLGGSPPSCLDAADVDDSGALNIVDPIFLIQHLFLGGVSLPGPRGAPGVDPTPEDPLGCLVRR